jgi:hypothetical protein
LPPGIALDSGNERGPDALECGYRIVFMKVDAGRQKRRNVLGQAARQLFQHPLLGVCAGDWFAFERQIVIEAGKKLVGIHGKLLQTHVQVEEIAILAALQERAQLGSEEFFRRK